MARVVSQIGISLGYRTKQAVTAPTGTKTKWPKEAQKENVHMAKNWKVGEAVQAIHTGSTEEKLDIGRRFPLFTILAAQTNPAGAALLNTIPDYVTARKLESVLKGDAQSDDGEGNDDESAAPAEPATPAKDPAAKAPAKANEDALAGKTPKELYAIAKELGIAVEPKQPADIYIKAIKKDAADKAKAAKATAAKGKDEDWGDDEPATPAKGAGKKKDEDEWDI